MKTALTVLKIGGNVLDNAETLASTLAAFAAWHSPKILVHGGGKIASQLMRQIGLEPKMADGRRITDRPTLDVVTMVYAGLINKNLVATLQSLACNAIGLTGADANLIPAVKRPVKTIDYGFVGDLTAENINTETVSSLLNAKLTPVLAPITHDGQGTLLNTNADTIASNVSIALAKNYHVKLVFCFEKKGVLSRPDDDNSVIPLLDETLYEKYKSEGVITAGMLPKLDNAFAALRSGIAEVHICSPANLGAGTVVVS
jgi:acetylglutamate kinase